ncbi:MAG: hypothetical protein M3N13_01770, partial [Candidatus Eremiobacteraeota bacterium]|nr:hypothetical protein [Candidatus Eremiobacteraeota bacterium]
NCGSIEAVRALNASLRSLHDVVPILAVDQEGGRVARLREGVETIPPMMAIGAAGSSTLCEKAGEQIGHDLHRAGFTVNFAPVLDLAREPLSTVIGTRSFGSDAQIAGVLGRAFASGLERYGITAAFKHFPGHGMTASDTHLGLPAVDLGLEMIRANDLAPFAAVAASAGAIMTAHVVVRAVDHEHPATLSKALLTGVLRGELGFDGVCFTDCMQMDAIARTIGTAKGAAAAIAAGADCAVISHDPALALDAARAIVDAVRSGALPLERLLEAHARVRRLRSGVAPAMDAQTNPHRGIGREIARKAITLLRGTPHADATTSIVVSFEGATAEGAQGLHSRHATLESQAPSLLTHVVSLEPSRAEGDAAIAAIFRSGRRPIVLLRRAHIYGEQAAAATGIIERFPDALVVSLREPYDCALFPQARHLLAAYGDDDASMGGLADVLFGGVVPSGMLPVDISA